MHTYTDETCQTLSTEKTVFQNKFQAQKVGTTMCFIREDAVEARRLVRPPIQATFKKGDVMLRDFRTWQAGMPNNTDQDRIMVAQGWMVSS